MEKASWRAGKTAIMYDLVQISKRGLSKTVFFVAGANQDAVSIRRCDLSHHPSMYWGDVCWRHTANIMTTEWGRFKGPHLALEWAFGSARISNAMQNQS